MKVVTGFFTVISIAALSMTAAQAAFVENKYNCEMSMEEAVDCGESAVKVEKKRLNKIYMSAHRTLSAKQKSQLDKEQAAWLKNRNKQCEFKQEGSMNNMAVWGMISADVCTATENQKRSKVLAKKYHIK
ncbi:lysozyme inhibitor LprI family protein [Psychrobacter glacincola]|uniref:Lysozyme inhibitor LprI family protein n=1 Tax=Psychrobacter glacincola TaxID=56810 RepID=A0ABW1W7A5_9GAMM|nr:lysozyme inhibitor LprI family protein [Psychrobacter glacincola]